MSLQRGLARAGKRQSLKATDAFLTFLSKNFDEVDTQLLISDIRAAVGHIDTLQLQKSIEQGGKAMQAAEALEELHKSYTAHTARQTVRTARIDANKYDEAEFALFKRMQKDATTSGVTVPLGLTPYALESPAYNIFPIVTKWRNRIPRNTVGGTGLHYKIITAIDTDRLLGFVPEGNIVTNSPSGRADILKISEVDGAVVFKTLGVDNGITLQARYGGRSSIDGADFKPDEVARICLIYAFAMREERAMIYGQDTALTAAAIGTVTKTAITQQATGLGTLTAATNYFIRVSALTGLGFARASRGRLAGVDSLGETIAAAEVTIATAAGGSAGDKSITAGWNDVANAWGYNVYASATTGTEVYIGTVYSNRVIINSIVAAGAGVTNVADTTADANAYVGIPGLLRASASNAYKKSLNGAALTADGSAGITEFDDMFLDRFQNFYSGPQILTMGPGTKKKVDALIAGSTAPVFRFNINNGDHKIAGTVTATGIFNRYTMDDVEFEVHPLFPDGVVVAQCDNLGQYYPLAGLPNPIQMEMGLDQIQFDFPSLGTYWPYGMYSIGAPVIRVTFPHGIITGIGTASIGTTS